MRLAALLAIFVLLPAAALSADKSVRETPVVRVIREWAPSVVNIATEQVVLVRQAPFVSPLGEPLLDPEFQITVGQMKLNSLGSGVVVSEDGLIVTNAHVVQMASRIFVTLKDGTSVEAKTVAVSEDDDLALIRIPALKPLKPVRLANDVIIGETVIAIGNQLGLQNSVSAGIVSGTNRAFQAGPARIFGDLIQVDAPLNPGSSGGALLNLEGDLMGINLAVVQEAQNINFAISVQKVRALLAEYEKYRKTRAEAEVRIPVKRA